MKSENTFNLARWLINTRRFVQAACLALFFFLVFHTQKVKDLTIPILNYAFILCLTIGIFYLGKYLYNIRKLNNTKDKANTNNLIKAIILVVSSIILATTLIYYSQLAKPSRAKYINNNELSIKQAIGEYKEEKGLYQSLIDFSAVKTRISQKDNAKVIIEFPNSLIYLNYIMLIVAIILISLALLRYKGNIRASKNLKASSIILLLISLSFFLLLDFDFKESSANYNEDSGFILHYFPTNLTNYYYFIEAPENLFLKLSPLLGVVTSISLATIIFGVGFILFFLVISFVFGRVFCGWVCPFGTIHQIVSFIKMKVKGYFEHEPFKQKQRIKYAIFITILITGLFSINLSGFLDPIAIVTKSTTFFLIPSAQYIVNKTYNPVEQKATQEKTIGTYSVLLNIFKPIKEYLETYVFYFQDPAETGEDYVPTHFKYFFLNGFIFVLLIALNLKTTRFWCRYICPLGAMLGIFANRSLMRIDLNSKCTSCTDCEKFCQGAADVGIKDGFKTSECMYCFNCMSSCTHDALEIKWANPFPIRKKQELVKLPVQKLDLNRRRLAKSFAYGLSLFILFRSTLWARRTSSNKLIRPPGSIKEEDFLRKCIKCSECMKVCPKNFLHPAFLEAGIEGMFTPVAVGTLGYCEHTCKACMDVCPTDAIAKYPLNEKQEIKIGLAIISKDRCLTYASQTPCIVCEEHCPTSPKAIWTHKKRVKRRTGEEITIDQINVDPNLCIGCGICEYVCPVVDDPAIYISSIQETRSKENRLLLEEEG